MSTKFTLTLPPEPQDGAIVEILDGNNKGQRYRNDSGGWRRVGPFHFSAASDEAESWSSIWWAVAEDAGGGTSVLVTIPDPADPHPVPWSMQAGRMFDANGEVVPPRVIVERINATQAPESMFSGAREPCTTETEGNER